MQTQTNDQALCIYGSDCSYCLPSVWLWPLSCGLSSLNSHLCVISEEKVKDYRYYLRMWAKEKEPKTETIKDLPRMNQVTM